MMMTDKTALLMKLIAAKSATSAGFMTADAKPIDAEKNAAKICKRQATAGLLFRERAAKTTFAYFATQALADDFRERYQAARLAKKPSYRETGFLRSAGSRHGERLAPVKGAVIIHTEKTRYTSNMMPPPRNQVITHSFIHGGMGAMR